MQLRLATFKLGWMIISDPSEDYAFPSSRPYSSRSICWIASASRYPRHFLRSRHQHGRWFFPHIHLVNSNAAHNAFFGNLTGTNTQTFESYAAGITLPLTISFGAAGNATLTDASGGGVIESGADPNGYFPISGTKFLATGSGRGFTITFSSPVSAFGFYGTDVSDVGATLSPALTGTNPMNLTVPATVGTNGSTSGSALYFSFYDLTNTYTSITFDNTGGPGTDVFGFDDFTIGNINQVTPTATPKPSSIALLGSGLTALWCARRRLRRS